MLNDSLQRRLEALNRGPLPSTARAIAADGPTLPATISASTAWRGGDVPALAGLVRRGEAVITEAGEHWLVCLALNDLWPGGESLVRQRCERLTSEPPAIDSSAWWNGVPDEAIFLDLETCGFSGSALFLAGLLRPIEGRLNVELLLARDYSEESAVLASLWQRLDGVATIVTFNGKSFDWPMIVDRSRRHLLAKTPPSAPRHVDLLHLARRRWRRELPDCKLQTLERHVCGRRRADDMPSHQIPAAFQQFVRTGFEREMDSILLHNAIDLVTMLDMAMRMAGDANVAAKNVALKESDKRARKKAS